MNFVRKSYNYLLKKIKFFFIGRRRRKAISKILKITSISNEQKEKIIHILEGTSELSSAERIEFLSKTENEISDVIGLFTDSEIAIEMAYEVNENIPVWRINIDELRTEWVHLNQRLFELIGKQKRLTPLVENNFAQIDLFLDKLNEIQNKYKNNTQLEFNTSSYEKLLKDKQNIEMFLTNSYLVDQYKKRERENVKKEKDRRDLIKKLFNDAEYLINKLNLDEAERLLKKGYLLMKSDDQVYLREGINRVADKLIARKEKENYKRQELETKKILLEAESQKKLLEDAQLILKEQVNKEIEEHRLKAFKEQNKQLELAKLLVKKNNWEDIEDYLEKNQVEKLYHFTDRSNINSIIKAKGLFSWSYCDNNEIEIKKPGGDVLSRDLDRKNRLQDFVRVCFNKTHPMMFAARERIPDPVILFIKIDVCYFKESLFSDSNAASNNHKRGNDLEGLKLIKMQFAKNNGFPENDIEKKYKQAEVLVKTWIPLEFITNIQQINQEHEDLY